MRILILGAGAIGGYLGARLIERGADVTFLVRPARAERLARDGLRVVSPQGDSHVAARTVTAESVGADYDLVLLSCKAFDLASAIDAVRPAMAGSRAYLVPLLNGLRHLDDLDAAFGRARVLGGTAHISVTLGEDGTVHHLNKLHRYTYGPRVAGQQPIAERARPVLTAGNVDLRLSDRIETDMWEKLILLATLAGMTCMMRASMGDIVATRDGRRLILAAIDECAAIAVASGQAPREAVLAVTRGLLTEPGSALKASMLRDIEHGNRIEADHIIGDLVMRAAARGIPAPLLETAYCHLQAYQLQRGRADAAATGPANA